MSSFLSTSLRLQFFYTYFALNQPLNAKAPTRRLDGDRE